MGKSLMNLPQNGQKIFWISCACVGAYVAYRYWKKRESKAIDEGFEDVTRLDDSNERRVLLLGLKGAGKTSVMNQAVAADSHGNYYQFPPKPTDGFAVYRLKKGNYIFNVWEIGGSEETKQHWSNFLQDTDLLVFMVDASDADKLSQAVLALKQLLGDSRMDNVPILVIANKQDVSNALRMDQIKKALDLHSISPLKHKVEVIESQTMPMPPIEPGIKEYNWYHPSIDTVRKKIFSLATIS
ncbi:ADP-ribosylation factor-like protein 3 [Chelonus insularis]|uniref:ADP-ribosylation factor-like protein 3 n=1 Tax=Chelonus insularis TaxID=460826 RepID=UPI00158DE47D|nr:ADP-ribosylation factor-like protein 3 [Chelonus insularis]